MIGALFFVLTVMPVEGAAEALASAALDAEIGVSAMRFKYDEFNDVGRVLDTEQGRIPGLSFSLRQRRSAWEWESLASYHHGRVDYRGQTNYGAPYNTRTDETIADVALRLGRWFEGAHPWMMYGGLGYRRWDRDILPNTLGGLFESYRWSYVWLGTKIMVLQKGKSQHLLDVGWVKPFAPQIRVDFKGTYNVAPVVYPESKSGVRMMWTSNLALSENNYLSMTPYFEYWELGRSSKVSGGGVTIYEPASKTKNIGLNFRFGHEF